MHVRAGVTCCNRCSCAQDNGAVAAQQGLRLEVTGEQACAKLAEHAQAGGVRNLIASVVQLYLVTLEASRSGLGETTPLALCWLLRGRQILRAASHMHGVLRARVGSLWRVT